MRKYFLLHPSTWNDVKTKIEKGSKAICSDTVELPGYVNQLLEALEVEKIKYSESLTMEKQDDNLVSVYYSPKEPAKAVEALDEEGNTTEGTTFDYEAMFSESWDSVVDQKNIFIECTKDNVCSTINYFNRWCNLKSNKIRGIYYNYKILIWKEIIPSFNPQQIEIISRSCLLIELASIFNANKIESRISICPDEVDQIPETSEYVHIITDGKDIKPIYRRVKLNEFLKDKFGDDLKTDVFLGASIAKTCIISYPTLNYPPAEKYFYDRTDNWSCLSLTRQEQEEEIIKIAEKITCSSKWLYNDTIKIFENIGRTDVENIKYVPNGNVMFDYPESVTKFEKKTAIYIGNYLYKVDKEKLYLLCELNPEWDFLLYSDDADKFTNTPSNLTSNPFTPIEELFPIICKCHAGLILLNDDVWSAGMLPNKTFNYINARIPILYSGIKDETMEDFKEVAFNANNHTLEELANLDISPETFDNLKRDWSDVTKELEEFYGI